MKYVMIRVTNGDVQRDLPIIFPDILVHSMVAERVVDMLVRDHSVDLAQVVSAGEIQMDVAS